MQKKKKNLIGTINYQILISLCSENKYYLLHLKL